MSVKVIVFSDVHGNYEAYLAAVNSVGPGDICICLGDLIDRGNRSVDIIIDYANRMKEEPGKWFFILGNHENMLQFFLLCPHDPDDLDTEIRGPEIESLNIWFSNGGATVCEELYEANDERITEFLNAFAFIMSQGYARCYLRTRYLYVLTHAGATDSSYSSELYGPLAHRVWSRVDAVEQQYANYGISFNSERGEIDRRYKERFDRQLNDTHRKYYVFGHTPTRREVIERRWARSEDYNYTFLPLDAGLARTLFGETGQIAIGEIRPDTHRVNVLPAPGSTCDYFGEERFMVAMCPIANRIKDIWENRVFPYLVDQDLFKNTITRTFAVSWVKNWIRDNFRLNYSPEMEKYCLNKEGRDWESFYGERGEFLAEPEIVLPNHPDLLRRSPSPIRRRTPISSPAISPRRSDFGPIGEKELPWDILGFGGRTRYDTPPGDSSVSNPEFVGGGGGK